jgi:hypothetical protein
MLKKLGIVIGVVACLATSSFAGSKYFTKDTVNYAYNMNTTECVKLSENMKNLLLEVNKEDKIINFKAEKRTPSGGFVFVIETPTQNEDGSYSKLTNILVSDLESCKELGKIR